MHYPIIITFEMSSYEEDAFPIAAAWSLSDGQIKSTLISPDSDWLEQLYEQGLHLDYDPDALLHEGHSPKSVLEELQLDLGEEALYCVDPYQTEQALEKLSESIERELELTVRPVAELLSDSSFEEREDCRAECTSLLELNEHQATDQVRLWLEIYVRLAGSGHSGSSGESEGDELN